MQQRYVLAAVLVALPLAAALAAGAFDGKYSGSRSAVRGGPPICPADGNVTWSVADSRITLPFWATSVIIDVTASGSFQKSFQYRAGNSVPGNGTWQGQITGNNLVAELETGACKLHYKLTKQ